MRDSLHEQEFGLAAAVLATLCALLAALGALLAAPGAAWASTGQPLAYVSNGADNTISVLDTGDNKVVETIRGVSGRLTVMPDGQHLLVTGAGGITVIETRTFTVTSTFPDAVGGLAVAPDGRWLYYHTRNEFRVIDPLNPTVALATVPVPDHVSHIVVASNGKRAYVMTHDGGMLPGSVHMIDARTDTLLTTLHAGSYPLGGIETPDGKYFYVLTGVYSTGAYRPSSGSSCYSFGSIQGFETETGNLVGKAGGTVGGIAMMPDAKRAYVSRYTGGCRSTHLAVLDTATSSIVGYPIGVGQSPGDVAVTPDGRHAYVVTDYGVSVIDTATDSVVATVPVGNNPHRIAIVPPPRGVPFASFTATLGRRAAEDLYDLRADLTLSSTASDGIDVGAEPVKFQVGPYVWTIPAGSFVKGQDGVYRFDGDIELVRDRFVTLRVEVETTGTLRYVLRAVVSGFSPAAIANPVQVSMSIGDDAGLAKVDVMVASAP